MKKIFVDTNVWLRFLVADEPKQFEKCRCLFERIEKGKFRTYTSTIVLLEIIYTLSSFYKISKKEVIGDIESILSVRNLTLIEKTSFIAGLKLFSQFQVKLADCLIASQLPKEVVLCSYDQEFKKIKGLISYSPEEIIEKAKD